MSEIAPPKARRTQAERSSAMRDRLLEATLDCLVERGYGGTTTAAIEGRAGVSRGARMHHFPAKADLLGAAALHLFRGLRETFESRFKQALAEERLPEGDRFKASFELLWSNFEEPRHAAVLELFLAARSDAALRAELRRATDEHHAHMLRRVQAYFPEASGDLAQLAGPIMESIHAAMEGLALRRAVFGEDKTERQVLDTVMQMARQLILAQLQR